MKKTFTINIAGIVFNIEADAYEQLDAYINSIKAHFSTYPDHEEIVSDIETRIAEQFGEIAPGRVITSTDISKLISIMGKVEDFADSDTQTAPEQPKIQKKLYRDDENKIIAGVAAGMAQYFGIDTVVMRLIFIILLLVLNVGALVIYIILAIAIPKATTPTEKLQMRGAPMNLSSFEKNIKKHVATLKEKAPSTSGFKMFLGKIFEVIGTVVRGAVKVFSRLFGLAVVIGSGIGFLALTFTIANLTFNIDSPYVQFPLAEIITGTPYFFIVLTAYTLAVIPLAALIMIGSSLVTKRALITWRSGVILISLWLLTVIVAGVLYVRYFPVYREGVSNLPQYQTLSHTYDLKGFNKIELHGVDRVQIKQGKEYGVVAQGRKIDLDRIDLNVEDSKLVLTQKSLEHFCYFCLGREIVEIHITVPNLSEIQTYGVVQAKIDQIKVDSLNIVTTGSSRLTIQGTGDKVTISASGISRINAGTFSVSEIFTEASGNSRVVVNAQKVLNVIGSGNSRVTYFGKPTIEKDLSGNARLISTVDATETTKDSNDWYHNEF